MNLPNKLTLLRIILIPVFMAVLYWGFPNAGYVALAIFIVASLTDLLDGKITFHQYITPYTPAEDIEDVIEFDPDALTTALS